jgi:hypothetical protein
LRAVPSGCEPGAAEPVGEETNRARVSVDMLRARWSAAFDAALVALRCAGPYLPADELRDRATLLEAERDLTTVLLQALRTINAGASSSDH